MNNIWTSISQDQKHDRDFFKRVAEGCAVISEGQETRLSCAHLIPDASRSGSGTSNLDQSTPLKGWLDSIFVLLWSTSRRVSCEVPEVTDSSVEFKVLLVPPHSLSSTDAVSFPASVLDAVLLSVGLLILHLSGVSPERLAMRATSSGMCLSLFASMESVTDGDDFDDVRDGDTWTWSTASKGTGRLLESKCTSISVNIVEENVLNFFDNYHQAAE